MQESDTLDNWYHVGGHYYADPSDADRARFYREQDEQRRVRERVTRTELWLTVRLAGEQFASEDQMRHVVTNLSTTLGYKMDAELSDTIRAAVANLWQTGRYHAAPAGTLAA